MLLIVTVVQDEVGHYGNENGDSKNNNVDGSYKVSFSCIYNFRPLG